MNARTFAPLRADIERELEALSTLEQEARQLLDEKTGEPTFWQVRTAGSILHDFYTGIEKIFRRIALEIDGGLPAGPDWHIQLLERMSTSIESCRPAVISRELKELLSEYLRFRHLFRYVYGFKLRWDRCEELLRDMPDVKARFEKELRLFEEFLRSLE